jgi:hypothetical protein
MKKKTVFVHIGTHKTGSTSLKVSLRKSKKYLNSQGLNYLETDWSYDLMKKNELDTEVLEHIRKAFLKQVSQCPQNNNIIISAEKFSGDPYTGYSNAMTLASSLKLITEGFDVKLLVYLRRQDSFIESLYSQSIHQGAHWSFNEFMQTRPSQLFDWNKLILSFELEFGESQVNVRSYDYFREASDTSLHQDFFEFLGVTDLTKIYQGKKDTNISYSAAALGFARRVNKYIEPSLQKAFRYGLQKSNSSKRPKLFLTSNQRADVLRTLHSSNQVIAKRKLNKAEASCLLKEPLIQADNEMSHKDKFEELEEIVARYIAYNEIRPSAEPREILRSFYYKYFLKNKT